LTPCRLAFVICTEAGRLERQSLVLAQSIRTFAGKLRNAPIYSFQPRAGFAISPFTAEEFARLGVIHRNDVLNERYRDYPLANKPLVAAFAERAFSEEFLVFVDSDKVFFQEPARLLLDPGIDVAVRPVDVKNVGTDGKSDENQGYWAQLAAEFQIPSFCRVTTTVDRQQILGYWNSGLVSVRRSTGIFAAWKENFETALELGMLPPKPYFLDQCVLAATIHALGVAVAELPPSYNYPLHLQHRIAGPSRITSFRQMTSAHYHVLFEASNWPSMPSHSNPMRWYSRRARWLAKQLQHYRHAGHRSGIAHSATGPPPSFKEAPPELPPER
jgi:hypothetical protein